MERLEDGISPSAAPSPTPKDNNNIPGISPVTYAKAAAPRPRVYITRPIHLPDSLADVPMSGPAMAGTVSKQLSVKVFCDVVPVFKAKGAIGKALLVHYPEEDAETFRENLYERGIIYKDMWIAPKHTLSFSIFHVPFAATHESVAQALRAARLSFTSLRPPQDGHGAWQVRLAEGQEPEQLLIRKRKGERSLSRRCDWCQIERNTAPAA